MQHALRLAAFILITKSLLQSFQHTHTHTPMINDSIAILCCCIFHRELLAYERISCRIGTYKLNMSLRIGANQNLLKCNMIKNTNFI